MPGVLPHISGLIGAYLVQIGALFQPEARSPLTCSPQIPDGFVDLLMTTDTVPKIR